MTCKYKSKEEGVACTLESHSPGELGSNKYCCFHLPFENKDSKNIKKLDWGTEELNQFEQVLKNLIGGIPNNSKLDLSGTKIPTEITIKNNLSELELSSAHFKGRTNINLQSIKMVRGKAVVFEDEVDLVGQGDINVDFSGSDFQKNLTLESGSFGIFNGTKCSIGGNLRINSISFKSCIFKESKVQGSISLTNIPNLSEILDFGKVEFHEGSNLRDLKITGSSNFDGASVSDNIKITNCEFGENGSFRGLKTGEKVEFSNCTFGNNTSFTKIGNRHTAFGKRNTFSQITLGEKSDLTDCKFGIGFRFSSGNIGSECNFSGVKFGSKTKFQEVQIFRTSFSGSKFENQATFSKCKFHFKTDFSNLTFSKTTKGEAPLSFDGSEFNGNTDFQGSTFSGPVSFKESYFNQVDFSECVFSKSAIFLNRNFKESTSFRESVFEIAPQFHGATFHQDTDFTDSKFNDVESVKPARATASYRTLRHAMEQYRSRRNQAIFYSLEMRAARKTGEVKGFAKYLSILNDWFSEYGLSVDRPIWWFLGINVGFAGIYHLVGSIYGNNQWFPYIRFTMEQIVRPFYVWTGAFKPSDILNCIWSDVSEIFQILATFQSVFSIGLIALFLLSVRRQFKMD